MCFKLESSPKFPGINRLRSPMLANMADSDGVPGDDESDDAQAESCMALNKQQLLGMWRV